MDVSPSLVYRDPKAALEFSSARVRLWHGDSCVMFGGERSDGLGQPPGMRGRSRQAPR